RGRPRPDLAVGVGVDARRPFEGPLPDRLGGGQRRRPRGVDCGLDRRAPRGIGGSGALGGLPDEAGELLDAFGRGPDARSTGIPSGGGVPSWMAVMLNYCSRCGTELTFGPIEGEDRDRLGCPSSGHIPSVNPRLVLPPLPPPQD